MLGRVRGWSRKRKIIGLVAVSIVGLIVIGAIGSALESEESKQARIVAEQNAEATAVAAKRIEESSGLHCLSSWDGHHDGFIKLVKRQLKDPDSLTARETRIARRGASLPGVLNGQPGNHIVVMNFTARNSFGGTVRSDAVGYVRTDSCEATLVSIE